MSSLPFDFPPALTLFSWWKSTCLSPHSATATPRFPVKNGRLNICPNRPPLPFAHTLNAAASAIDPHYGPCPDCSPDSTPARVSGESERKKGQSTDKGILLPFPHPSIRPSEARRPTTAVLPCRQSEAMEGKVAGDPVNLVADLRDN